MSQVLRNAAVKKLNILTEGFYCLGGACYFRNICNNKLTNKTKNVKLMKMMQRKMVLEDAVLKFSFFV